MPKFIIEREMPQVGKLTDTDFQGAAQKSCDVLRGSALRSSGSRAMSPPTRYSAFITLPARS